MIFAIQLAPAIAFGVRVIKTAWEILTEWLQQPVADGTIPPSLKEPTKPPEKPTVPTTNLPVVTNPNPV